MGHWWTEGVAPLLRGLAAEGAVARPIVAVRPSGLTALCHSMARAEQAWVAACGFVGAAGEVLALPGEAGIARVLLGLGDGSGPFAFGGLAERLAPGAWSFDEGALDRAGASAHDAVLGFLLGAYRVRGGETGPELSPPADTGLAVATARAMTLARDLINAPPNELGPSELADAVGVIAHRFGAAFRRVEGAALASGFPAVAAVGAGSSRAPVVARCRGAAARRAERRRSCRWWARACASTPAATTSRTPPACCA